MVDAKTSGHTRNKRRTTTTTCTNRTKQLPMRPPPPPSVYTHSVSRRFKGHSPRGENRRRRPSIRQLLREIRTTEEEGRGRKVRIPIHTYASVRMSTKIKQGSVHTNTRKPPISVMGESCWRIPNSEAPMIDSNKQVQAEGQVRDNVHTKNNAVNK